MYSVVFTSLNSDTGLSVTTQLSAPINCVHGRPAAGIIFQQWFDWTLHAYSISQRAALSIEYYDQIQRWIQRIHGGPYNTNVTPAINITHQVAYSTQCTMWWRRESDSLWLQQASWLSRPQQVTLHFQREVLPISALTRQRQHAKSGVLLNTCSYHWAVSYTYRFNCTHSE